MSAQRTVSVVVIGLDTENEMDHRLHYDTLHALTKQGGSFLPLSLVHIVQVKI